MNKDGLIIDNRFLLIDGFGNTSYFNSMYQKEFGSLFWFCNILDELNMKYKILDQRTGKFHDSYQGLLVEMKNK